MHALGVDPRSAVGLARLAAHPAVCAGPQCGRMHARRGSQYSRRAWFQGRVGFSLWRARSEALGQSIVSTRYCQAEPAGGPPLMGPRRGGRSAQAVAQDAAVGRRLYFFGCVNLQWRAAHASGCYGLSYLPEEGMWLGTQPLNLSILSRVHQAHLPGRHPQRGNRCARRSWWDW